MKNESAERLERAKELHRRVVVLDSHIDTTLHLGEGGRDLAKRNDDGHLDIPRMREGGVSCAVFAVWAPNPEASGEGIAAARDGIEKIHRAIERYGDDLSPAVSGADVRRAKEAGKIAVPLAIEGGYLFEEDLDVLREFRAAGAIYLTLTHGFHISWADSAGVHEPLGPLHGGLTPFGRDVVRELNRIGMIVDVSHVSDDTFLDVLEVADAPVAATHSSCRAIANHRRNMSDDMMRAVAETGGVVQINFSAAFIDPDFPEITNESSRAWRESKGTVPLTDYVTPFSILVDHFDHALRTIGPDHVGVGSDFDGVACLPEGMGDCSRLPYLTAALLERGYSEEDLEKVLGGNFLRVMETCSERSKH